MMNFALWLALMKHKAQSEKKMREAIFFPEFRQALQYWVKTDRKLALRVLEIVEGVLRDPFTGIGKPEPLKHVYLAHGRDD
jgi:toxin YoeB